MQIQIDWNLEKPDPALTSFIAGFHEKRKKELVDVQAYVETKNFTGLAQLAHNWKGYSRPYGYVGLEFLAKALEKAAKDQNQEECRDVIEQVATYLDLKEARLNEPGPNS